MLGVNVLNSSLKARNHLPFHVYSPWQQKVVAIIIYYTQKMKKNRIGYNKEQSSYFKDDVLNTTSNDLKNFILRCIGL